LAFFSENAIIDYKSLPVITDMQPDLSGALFAGAKRRQKSGNGGRKKLPKSLFILNW
jgi:hypothetical protein